MRLIPEIRQGVWWLRSELGVFAGSNGSTTSSSKQNVWQACSSFVLGTAGKMCWKLVVFEATSKERLSVFLL